MAALAITHIRADLLRAIDNGHVTHNRRNGETYRLRPGDSRLCVTGRVRVMRLAGLVERVDHGDDRVEVDVRLTDAGRKALAGHDATERS